MNIENTPQLKRRAIHSSLYQKAFAEYLRRGIPLTQFLKAKTDENHVTDKYVWYTLGDDKVRPSHAAHEQEIISWDDPPDIGHPSEDYNCRCMAIPYLDGLDPSDLKEMNFESVIMAAADNPKRWDNAALARHYLNGDGKPVTLQEIGQLREIIQHVQTYPIDKYGQSISRRVLNNFAEKIRDAGIEPFHNNFERPYDFKPVEWAHGKSTLSGEANGYVSTLGPFLIFNLTIDYRFSDSFKDPLDIGQNIDLISHVFKPADRPESPTSIDFAKPYDITGTWRTRIEAVIYQDKYRSNYYYREDENLE